MGDSFQKLRNLLLANAVFPNEDNYFDEEHYKRLHMALKRLEESSADDIASLFRHVMRHEQERQMGVPSIIKVPTEKQLWPSREVWEKNGIDVLSGTTDYYLLQSKKWSPSWVRETNQGIDDDCYAGKNRRNFTTVPGDPFLKKVGLDAYRCNIQREGIRAILSVPDGATVLGVMPTGAGKSLCAYLPAVIKGVTGRLTVVVVPTTALAIDQAKSVQNFFPHATAYYDQSRSEGACINQEIKKRMASGEQGIVFTSPESLLGSLGRSVYTAAKKGFLKMFVIDEAHMVDQWGDEFRSSFQELSGFRKDLLRVCGEQPFKTLLLSATVTASCLKTLHRFFSYPGPFEVVASAQVRSEPSYWTFSCPSENERNRRVKETIHNLPRPIIVYTTKVSDAEWWHDELKREGFLRCGLITGKTGTSERLNLIDKWRAKRIDIMVATSAFGLGVDQNDVRAVLHLCIPETVDRYYQEVGRSGRDGRASLAMMFYVHEDIKIAHGMAQKKIITVKRGFTRWQSMFSHKETLPDGRYRVAVDQVPSYDEDDIDMKNDANIRWNVRTLMLMQRAGLIELDWENPPDPLFDALDEGAYQTLLSKYANGRIITLLGDHLNINVWEDKVEKARGESLIPVKKSLQRMDAFRAAERCIADVLQEEYQILQSDYEEVLKANINVVKNCSGCPYCKKNDYLQYTTQVANLSKSLWKTSWSIPLEAKKLLGTDNRVAVFYDRETQSKTLMKAVNWFGIQGFCNLIVNAEMRSFIFDPTKIEEGIFFLHEKYSPGFMPKLPTVFIYDPEIGKLNNIVNSSASDIPLVGFFSLDLRDPINHQRSLYDILSWKKYGMDELKMEVML